MKEIQDVIERLWDFIDKLDINTFGKFLADNIVGSVVVFSLVFWVPLSILVHYVVGAQARPVPALPTGDIGSRLGREWDGNFPIYVQFSN